MTTNEHQPGEVHRAADLPPVHLHTLLPSIKIFKTRFHLHQEETNESGDKIIMIITVIIMLMIIMMILIRKP